LVNKCITVGTGTMFVRNNLFYLISTNFTFKRVSVRANGTIVFIPGLIIIILIILIFYTLTLNS